MLKCSDCEQGHVNYKHTLTVQSPGGTAGAGGHADLTDDANWTNSGTIKARFLGRSGREGRVFDQVQAEVSHIVETPSNNFSRGIHPNQRISWDSRIFNIVSAFDIEELHEIVRIQLTEVI